MKLCCKLQTQSAGFKYKHACECSFKCLQNQFTEVEVQRQFRISEVVLNIKPYASSEANISLKEKSKYSSTVHFMDFHYMDQKKKKKVNYLI